MGEAYHLDIPILNVVRWPQLLRLKPVSPGHRAHAMDLLGLDLHVFWCFEVGSTAWNEFGNLILGHAYSFLQGVLDWMVLSVLKRGEYVLRTVLIDQPSLHTKGLNALKLSILEVYSHRVRELWWLVLDAIRLAPLLYICRWVLESAEWLVKHAAALV